MNLLLVADSFKRELLYIRSIFHNSARQKSASRKQVANKRAGQCNYPLVIIVNLLGKFSSVPHDWTLFLIYAFYRHSNEPISPQRRKIQLISRWSSFKK